MTNFLIVSYSFKIKKIYDDIKEKIPSQLIKFTWKNNRERMVVFTKASVQRAYKEGLSYAKAYINLKALDPEGKKKIKEIEPKISNAALKRLYEQFIVRIKNSEKTYKQKIDNLRNLGKLANKRINLKKGSQELIAWSEYVNGVKTATDNLIINAGAEGQRQIWEIISIPDILVDDNDN